MSFKHIIFSAACVLLLSACGNETSNKSDEGSSINEEQQQQSENKQQPDEQDDQQESQTIDDETEDDEQEIESVDEDEQEEAGSINTKPQVTQNSKSTEQDDDDQDENEEARDEDEDEDEDEQDGESGFSVVNGAVESADDIPKVDEIAILAAFDEYIAAFNAQDIKRYEKVLAQDPEGFDLDEDLVNSKRIFDNFEVHREASNITITEYTGSTAYVYADVVIDVKQDNSSSHDEGKQLTQFVKESSGWKVTSLQAIGSAAKD